MLRFLRKMVCPYIKINGLINLYLFRANAIGDLHIVLG